MSNSNRGKWQTRFDVIAPDWDNYYTDQDYASRSKQMRAQSTVQYIEKHLPKGSKILDIGCGSGKISCDLAKRGYQVTGVDFSKNMIEISNKNAVITGTQSNCRFLLGELEDLKLENQTFNATIALGYFEYIMQPESIIKEISRILVPSGICIAQIWNRWRLTNTLDFRNGPFRIIRPRIFIPKFQALLTHASQSIVQNEKTPPLINRKWYTPLMLDKYMSDAGLIKNEHIGFGFSEFRYGKKMLLSESSMINLESFLVKLSHIPLFKKLQLLGGNYIGIYSKSGSNI